MNNTNKFGAYLAGIIAITLWIYMARIFFGLEFGWELIVFIFFSPPFIVLTVFAALGLRKSIRRAPATSPTASQKIIFTILMASGLLLGLVSPSISDSVPERSVLISGDVELVYGVACITFIVYLASLVALLVTSYIIAKKSVA